MTREPPEGVHFTHLDEELFEGAGATKRDLVDYLDAASELLLPELAGRALSVIRVHRAEAPFMQKNLPRYTPEWVQRVTIWAEASRRELSYAVCEDRRALLWFANQRAVEYHPSLVRVSDPSHMDHLVVDLDPPSPAGFAQAVQVAIAARDALGNAGLEGAVKTSGAKGLHIRVPIEKATIEDAAAATRALAARVVSLVPDISTTQLLKADRGGRVFVDATRVGAATVVAAFSPRARPGVPISFPVPWRDLHEVSPTEFNIRSFSRHAAQAGTWTDEMPRPRPLPEALVDEGLAIPAPRVAAMREGRRRTRALKSPGN